MNFSERPMVKWAVSTLKWVGPGALVAAVVGWFAVEYYRTARRKIHQDDAAKITQSTKSALERMHSLKAWSWRSIRSALMAQRSRLESASRDGRELSAVDSELIYASLSSILGPKPEEIVNACSEIKDSLDKSVHETEETQTLREIAKALREPLDRFARYDAARCAIIAEKDKVRLVRFLDAFVYGKNPSWSLLSPTNSYARIDGWPSAKELGLELPSSDIPLVPSSEAAKELFVSISGCSLSVLPSSLHYEADRSFVRGSLAVSARFVGADKYGPCLILSSAPFVHRLILNDAGIISSEIDSPKQARALYLELTEDLDLVARVGTTGSTIVSVVVQNQHVANTNGMMHLHVLWDLSSDDLTNSMMVEIDGSEFRPSFEP